MAKDEWDARFSRPKRYGMPEGKKQGLLLILVAIGIPLILFFFQENGELRFHGSGRVFERNITPKEREDIRQVIEKYKSRMDGIQKAVETVKEKYRGEMGEGYYSERWLVHSRGGFAVPFKYVLAVGALFLLVGIGKLIL